MIPLPDTATRAVKFFAAVAALSIGLEERAAGAQDDWAGLGRYRDDNARIASLPADGNRVVFMGDSITDFWSQVGGLFREKSYVNRGISGQTTPQMLVRFRQDVIDLRPAVVVILAGTNDIAGNTGPSTPEMTEDNLASMVDLAHANRIRVVLSSITPAFDYPWKPGLSPAEKIVGINRWIREYASGHNCVYLDYFSAMADGRDGMRAEYSADGVHPNAAGYSVMEPLAERAIASARALR